MGVPGVPAQWRARTRAPVSRVDRLTGWLRGARGGLFALAVLVGFASGLGAVAFRCLISLFTWLATGHVQFGQQGYVASAHLPWLGLASFVIIPVIGGLVYGPLIHRFAREARGHGVPEVMIAVAENGGRIRPQVSVVKAIASALTIGTGGSVGREGPIVQIGSAMASSLGQRLRMPESRLRILVACGAAGGIAATFNAPITGVFFGVEIILREFSIDALFTVMLSAMLADAVAEPLLGYQHFLSGFPTGIVLHSTRDYLLIAALAVIAALIGLGFAKFVYLVEDLIDRWWGGRPQWARPAVGGLALGALLLALPQMYGVGYPVMDKTVAGGYALWFLLILVVGKMLATSLTLGIGGSGGVFAPSLFIGVTSGMAFGEVVHHFLGAAAGQPALYAVVAMGAVFTAAARAPLTSLASVVEMTGDFALTLPVMLAVAIASTVSRAFSYGSIYTTKLLRRGTDIDRAAPWRAFGDLKVADVMRPLADPLPVPAGDDAVMAGDGGAGAPAHNGSAAGPSGRPAEAIEWAAVAGRVTHRRDPQAVFATESLTQAMRQLEIYGRDGLPVLSADGRHVEGWITNGSVLAGVGAKMRVSRPEAARAQLAADWALPDPSSTLRQAPTPLRGYQIVEVTLGPDSAATGRRLGQITWPAGYAPISVLHDRKLRNPDPGLVLTPGDRVNLLGRTPARYPGGQVGRDSVSTGAGHRTPANGLVRLARGTAPQ